MPHTKSAWKRLRQTEKRRRRNRGWAKIIKSAKKEAAVSLKAGDAAKIGTAFIEATKQFDKAAAKGVIHRNKAARMKSRLAKKVNAAKASA